MMQSNPYLGLISALDFSVADLYTNRRGELSDSQKTRIRHHRMKAIELWLVGMGVLVVVGLVLEAHWIAIVFGVCTIISLMMATWIHSEDDLQSGAHSTSGRLMLGPHRLFSSRYHLWVGKEHFLISGALKEALDTRYAYRIYFTAGNRTILSAETTA